MSRQSVELIPRTTTSGMPTWEPWSGSTSGRREVQMATTDVVGDPMLRPPYLLSGEIRPGWVAHEPITVLFEEEDDGTIIASDDISVVYGVGDTWQEALDDYVDSLIEYYKLVANDAERRGTGERTRLKRFRQYLRPAAR